MITPVLGLGFLSILFFMGFFFFAMIVILLIVLLTSKAAKVNAYCMRVEEKILKINPVHPALDRFKKSAEAVVRQARAERDITRARMVETILPDAVRAYETLRRRIDEKKDAESRQENTAETDKQIENIAAAFNTLAEKLDQWGTSGTPGAADRESADMIKTIANMG